MAKVPAKRGRKLHFPEKMEGAYRAGTIAAIAELRAPGEAAVEFIRTAVDREIERRSSSTRSDPPSQPDGQ